MTITEMIKDHKRDKLIISFIPLCKKLARQYNVDVGVAFETLIKSVSTLIKTQQLKKPITYIYYCVKFACIHYASENYIIRIPRTSKVKFKPRYSKEDLISEIPDLINDELTYKILLSCFPKIDQKILLERMDGYSLKKKAKK